MKASKKVIGNIVLTLIFLLIYVVGYTTQEASRVEKTKISKAVGIWDLSPLALSILAGEFKGLVSDYLTLEVGAMLGTKVERTETGGNRVVPKNIDCPAAHKIFQSSQSLDPSFHQTFIMAQGWLPWDCGMVNESIAILDVAKDNRPWDYQPSQFKAFNSYYFLNDPVEAGKIFLEAAKEENAPSYFAILGARLIKKGGATEVAIFMMKDMLLNKSVADPGFQDMVDRLRALEGTLVLENGVKEYKQRFGSIPESPENLVTTGLIRELPINPDDLPYCIDIDGNVFFDKPNCR